MEEAIAQVTAFITEHGAWAGPLVGVMAFGESLAVVGFLIPSTALLITVGGLIGTGTIPALPVYLWAVGGAVLGDWVSYSLGRWIGPAVYRHRWVKPHRSAMARAKLFFRRYGFVSIFIGRFLGPIRSSIPLVAGVMRMRFSSFQIANVSSALLWVPAMFAPGYLTMKGAGSLAEASGPQLMLVGLLAVGITVLAVGLGLRLLWRNR